MGRDYVYLGKRVPDKGKKGLDQISEVRGIRDAIISDRKAGRIDAQRAATRMNLLKLAVMRDRDFRGKKRQKAISIVNKGIKTLKKINSSSRRGTRRSR